MKKLLPILMLAGFSSPAFADITQIKADADTAACDIEILTVTA